MSAPVLPTALAVALLAATGGVLALLVPFGLHRMVLVRRVRRHRWEAPPPWCGPLPRVTVQLPIYNEAEVVERLIEAAGALDHPADRLEIQVLDDSTDETHVRAAAAVRWLRERGLSAEHLRRDRRRGFKAGALAEGTARARGEFLLILDADFVPPPDLIRRLLPPFRDPGVGMVQARWDHLNEEASRLTRCQALLLDGHFYFEQGGRHAAGRFLNFNGTAGMWRRRALDDAGGWSSDTLTEDLDVSYRAQMAGWRFVFLPGVGVPAELPLTIRALEVQQKRWAQGGVQTARKLLGRLWRGPWSLGVKMDGTLHLGGHLAQPLTVALGLLLLPSALARTSLGLERLLFVDAAVFASATLSFLLFFTAAGRKRGRPWRSLVPHALLTMVLGVGLSASVSRAVARGLSPGTRDVFHRTPKGGRSGHARYRSPRAAGDTLLKAGLTAWMVASAALAVVWGYFGTLPLLLLFASGWAWLGLGDLLEQRRAAGRESGPPAVPVAGRVPARGTP